MSPQQPKQTPNQIAVILYFCIPYPFLLETWARKQAKAISSQAHGKRKKQTQKTKTSLYAPPQKNPQVNC